MLPLQLQGTRRPVHSVDRIDAREESVPVASDPHDELAQFRARRNRERTAVTPDAGGDSEVSAEQQAAIERARESWALSHIKADGTPRDRPSDQE